MKKTLLAMALATLALTSYAEVVLKIAHVTQANSPKGAGADKFKELVEKYTNGSVKVEVYPASSLYGDRDEMKALQDNKVQMLAPSFSKMSVFYKTPGDNPWATFDMPFLFNSVNDLASLEKAGIYEEMNATLKDQYAFVFGIWDNGFSQLSTAQAITKWEDLSDLKIRIQPSLISKETVKSWGATPRVLAYNELSTGTFYGAVNASANPPSNMFGSKLMPVQKYLYKTNNAYLGYAVLMNRKFWDSLAPAQRDALTKAIKETRDFQVDSAERDNTFSTERIQNTGLTRVMDMDPAILNRMKKESDKVASVLSPTQKTYYDKIRTIVAKNAPAPAPVPVAAPAAAAPAAAPAAPAAAAAAAAAPAPAAPVPAVKAPVAPASAAKVPNGLIAPPATPAPAVKTN